MAKYAIAHALLGVSYVVGIGDDKPAETIRLKTEASKGEFFFKTLKPDDQVYMDLGGPNNKIALLAVNRGAQVLSIPTFRVGGKEEIQQRLAGAKWKCPDEKAHGNETGDKLTSRKARALALAHMALHAPDEFLAAREDDVRVLELQQAWRSYRSFQKVLLACYLRLVGTFNDSYLLELAKAVSEEDPNAAGVQATIRAIRSLTGYVPEEERAAFEAKVGLESLASKKAIKRSDLPKIFRAIIDEMMQGGAAAPMLKQMSDEHKKIVKILKSLKIAKEVFDPIPGCGPLITARIMSAIGDIRRFENEAKLRAFAGYHHFEDGSRARRKTGKASNWNMELKQATYLLCQQTLKMPKSPFRQKLDQRRGYELYKLLVQRQAQANAQDMQVDILPPEYRDRMILSVNDVTVEDQAKLAAHVDALRRQAGMKDFAKDDEEESEQVAEETDRGPDSQEEEAKAVKNPQLAKLMKGVKGSALLKALRWLGQYFLKHIYHEWAKAVGVTSTLARAILCACPMVHLDHWRPFFRPKMIWAYRRGTSSPHLST